MMTELSREEVLEEELRLARRGAEHLFQQAKEADANATIQFKARKIIEAALESERAVSDKLLAALKTISGCDEDWTEFADITAYAKKTITEVEALKKGE